MWNKITELVIKQMLFNLEITKIVIDSQKRIVDKEIENFKNDLKYNSNN